MTTTTPEYREYFRPGDQVTVGLFLEDRTFAEDSAKVIDLHGGTLRLELCCKGFPPHLPIPAGTRGIITRREGRTVFTGTGALTAPAAGRVMELSLEKNTALDERREYARSDVDISVHYSLPARQELGRIIREWEALKKCPGNCLKVDLLPCRDNCEGREMQRRSTRINLSGSGIRFKIGDCLPYGTLLHLKVAIADGERDHIHAVGAIVRTRELLPVMEQNAYYSTTMAFKVIDSHDRKKLLEYVLTEQRRAIL